MAKDKDTWVNREFDKYILGEKSPSQEPTSEQPSGSLGIGNDYLDKVVQGTVKMEELLQRMENLQVFIERQEAREQEGTDSYGQYLAAMISVADEQKKTADTFRDIEKAMKEEIRGLVDRWDIGFDFSEPAKNFLNALPGRMSDATKGAVDSVITACNSFKSDVRRFRWWVVGSIIWGILASVFGIAGIMWYSDARSEADAVIEKYERVEPELLRLRKNYKPVKAFADENPKMWQKWWEQHKKEYTE